MQSARMLVWLSSGLVASELSTTMAQVSAGDAPRAAPRACQILGPELPSDSMYSPATWPGGIVPYQFDANVDPTKREAFRQAAAEIEEAAAVTFVERTGEADYLHVQYAAANGSYVGRQGGLQMFYIYDWEYRYIIVHELMHALGFYHEHQRPDRDSYVAINPCNIYSVPCQDGVPTQLGALYQNNFAIVSTGLEAGPYDYNSLMHYGRCDYAAYCYPWGMCDCPPVAETITSPQPIGQTIGLSAGDIAGLQFLYSWKRPQVGGPTARSGHAMAFDSERGRLVMFGGRIGATLSAQLWERSGQEWVLRAGGGGPAPRQQHTLAYDSARHRTVLFGGMGGAGGAMGDTWEWDGIGWTQRSGSGPSPRYGAASAFDTGRGVLVVFGGRGGADQPDTWEWDGSAWSLRATGGPPARRDHAMSFDPERGRTVMFGGLSGSSARGDTWEWDGIAWTLVAAGGPPARSGHAMAYDPARDRVVVFGGIGAGGESLQDTWEWDGVAWEQRCAIGPTPRSFARMAFDGSTQEIVLFGGADGPTPMNDTWTLEPARSCYANCDGSSSSPMLNVADFTCFLQRFAAGDPWANCDGSTTSPAHNIADMTCFLQRFAAGCE